MLNVISAGLDKTPPTPERRRKPQRATFDVQSGADDTGLPMLVVRAPFNQCGSVCRRWKKWA
jgi:outer membrane protein assembly factor BamC